MPRRLEGRVAVVTGAGRGIGRAVSLHLAGAGAAVIVNDLGGASDGTNADQSVAEQTATEIRGAGGKARANGTSVANFEGCDRIITDAVVTFGRIDKIGRAHV